MQAESFVLGVDAKKFTIAGFAVVCGVLVGFELLDSNLVLIDTNKREKGLQKEKVCDIMTNN